MPSFLSRHGSNRLKKVKKTGDEGATGSAGLGGRDRRSSLASFLTVSNSDSTSESLNKVQRSESFKRRFGLDNILNRGKNSINTGQEIVSSSVGDILGQPTERGGSGELEVRSTDEALQSASAQQQSSATNTAGATTAVPTLRPSKKLHKERPGTNNFSTRVIPPAIVPPTVSTVLSSPAELSSQQRQDGHAATATMTSVMQQPKRRSFPLTLTVDELPRHTPRASSPPPPIPQTSKFNSSNSSFASPSANENLTPMPNPANDLYSPPFASPVISKPTSVGFPKPSLVDDSKNLLQARAFDSVNSTSSVELRGTIRAPVGYYLTPSQTPTLLDRSDPSFDPQPVPTVVRPGPSTPPLIEPPVPVSSPVAGVTNSTTRARPLQETGPSILIPDDRSFENGPPTPASSNSSRGRRVSFVEEAPVLTTSLVLMKNNVGDSYFDPPQQNRFDHYRSPPAGRPFSNHPRNYGPNQPPFRGPPRGRLLLRGPPRPPSPIYIPPPDLKNHRWQSLKASQLECSVGHSMVPFRNKQHSIVCMVCRSIEFEGRGKPVRKSFYCSWCAVRMCGYCKEELMGDCRGRLAELWDRTEEKRNMNMGMIEDGKLVERRESITPARQKPDRGSGESFGSRWSAAMHPVGDQDWNRTPQGVPSADTEDIPLLAQRALFQGQPESQLMIPRPQQSIAPRAQQSRTYQPQQPRAPQPQQSGTSQPQRPRNHPQPSDREQRQRQSHQPNRGPPPPEKPNEYVLGRVTPPNLLAPEFQGSYPPPVPQLTPEETQKYRLLTVPSDQKPRSSGTVVLIDEKQKEPSIAAASLKGSVTKKKRSWLRGFGKKKNV